MCANTAELSYETMLTDPLIQLVMQSDGVSHAQLVAVLHDAAEAMQARTELLPMRPRLCLVHSTALPLQLLAEPKLEIRATGT
jgi:hypothetical protein